MNNDLTVELGERSYRICIGSGSLDTIGRICDSCALSGRGLLVSDSNVAPLYAERVLSELSESNLDIGSSVIPAGEESKSERSLFELYSRAIEQEIDRKGFVIALGGGVVGDLAGYLAASYLRGIDFLQIPTSLLAMVDSSVGGKTGINLPEGKNLVGAFHQPRAVLVDVDTLDTLPEREWRAGLAEVVKYGVIADADFFADLEHDIEALNSHDSETIARIVARCCGIKADVVARDEREGGLRAILNYGHTLGHAIENAAGYGEYLHGEAVAIGMVYAGELSVELCGLPRAEADRIRNLIAAMGLPTTPPSMEWERLAAIMAHDKKAGGGRPRFVLAERIGKATPGHDCPEDICREVWDE